jgi:hypothetical protein
MMWRVVGSRGSERRFGMRTASAIALLIALLVTAVASWLTAVAVHDQEHRLLKERAAEVSLVLTSAINVVPESLAAQGGILRATDRSKSAYERSALASVAAGPGKLSFAWLRPEPSGSGYVVLGAAGDSLRTGEVVTDARVATFDRAMHSTQAVATPVTGVDRRLGFALGPPAAPAGTVLYRESALGPVAAPRAAASAPFAELDVVIYDSSTPNQSQILASTTRDLPLRGDVRTEPLAAGASTWLLSVKARRPLVGSVAADAPWLVLIVGVLASLLIATVIAAAASRRDAALALYAGEHQIAETLQRSLLPQLPVLPGLDLAARYLAAGTGQEVGGDWFDAFPISGGRVGLAIGDVIGHDLTAASAMAQIRASLRAYALDGDAPGSVINRLDHLVDTLDLTQLVTVIYAVLEPAEPDGSRLLRYTNAGHLPPLLREPHGAVHTLAGGDSVVIGAPITVQHSEAKRRLEPGSTLLFFTDGLVEVPGRRLEEALDRIGTTFARHDDAMSLDTLCEQVLATTTDRELRDDVALLVVRTASAQLSVTDHLESDPAAREPA